MSLPLPTFQNTYLQSISVCSCFPLGESRLSEFIEGLDGKTVTREARFDSSAGPAWIRVRVNRIDRDSKSRAEVASYNGHVHIDCALESAVRASRARTPAPNTEEEVRELLEMCTGENVGQLCCEGRFRLPKDNLPKRGLVELMLDVSTRVGEAEMAVIGATLDIRGRPPYDELRWRLKPETGGAAQVEVTITAFADLDVAGVQLERISQILSDGVQELVIESASEHKGTT